MLNVDGMRLMLDNLEAGSRRDSQSLKPEIMDVGIPSKSDWNYFQYLHFPPARIDTFITQIILPSLILPLTCLTIFIIDSRYAFIKQLRLRATQTRILQTFDREVIKLKLQVTQHKLQKQEKLAKNAKIPWQRHKSEYEQLLNERSKLKQIFDAEKFEYTQLKNQLELIKK